MANYAIYKDNVIINVIVADSKEIAEQVTGMNAIETEGSPWVGWTLINGVWVGPAQPESQSIKEPIVKEEVVEE